MKTTLRHHRLNAPETRHCQVEEQRNHLYGLMTACARRADQEQVHV
jgi:hypothetical protein